MTHFLGLTGTSSVCYPHSVDLIDALKRIENDISAGRKRQIELEEERVRIAEELSDLRGQLHCLTNVIRKYGSQDVADALDAHEEDNGWDSLTRLDAVERVLALAGGPRHISKIVAELHAKGRNDTVDLVSVALSDLKNRRQSVENVGSGHWRIRGGQAVLLDMYSRGRRELTASSSQGVSHAPSQGAEGAREGGGW